MLGLDTGFQIHVEVPWVPLVEFSQISHPSLPHWFLNCHSFGGGEKEACNKTAVGGGLRPCGQFPLTAGSQGQEPISSCFPWTKEHWVCGHGNCCATTTPGSVCATSCLHSILKLPIALRAEGKHRSLQAARHNCWQIWCLCVCFQVPC